MTGTHVVSEATDADIDAIAAFFWEGWRQAGPDAPGWAGASESVMEELTDPELLLARIGGPDRRMWLAWEDDRVVGFAATRRLDEEVVELAGIVVLQDQLGQGIGSPLLVAAVSAAERAGFARMVVRTEASNARAAGFYRARGFEDSAVVDEVVEGEKVQVLELTRDLSQ